MAMCSTRLIFMASSLLSPFVCCVPDGPGESVPSILGEPQSLMARIAPVTGKADVHAEYHAVGHPAERWSIDHRRRAGVDNDSLRLTRPARSDRIGARCSRSDYVQLALSVEPSSRQDGIFAAVPAEDRDGNPHDFSESATLKGADQLDLIGQGRNDPILGSSSRHSGLARHLGNHPRLSDESLAAPLAS